MLRGFIQALHLPPTAQTNPFGYWLKQALQTFQHFIPFALVGISGLLVNSLVLALATEGAHIYYLVSAALATLASTLWNFTLTEMWVFRDRRRPGLARRLALFVVMNNVALLLRGPLMFILTTDLSLHYLLSNLISIGAVTVARYLFADRWIWRSPTSSSTESQGKLE